MSSDPRLCQARRRRPPALPRRREGNAIRSRQFAGAARHSAQNIAFHEVGRAAIMADPDWRGGAYEAAGVRPEKGLAVARMAAHITYLSEAALQRKFGRELQRDGLSWGFETDFQVESLPSIGLAGGEADAAQRIVEPGKERSPTPRPGAERGNGSSGGSPRPEAGERPACPMRECQGSATHSLDECEKFRSLPVAQRGRRVKNWSRCECCLTDCRDRRTGVRCYRRTGFRRHHLLRMVPQAEVSPAGEKKRRQQQLRKSTAKGGQTASQGKPGRGDSGRDQGQTIPPQRQTDRWNFPVFSKKGEMVWLRATAASK